MDKQPQRYFQLMLVLLGIYVALTIINRPSAKVLAMYNLTPNKALLIILTVNLFLGFIWLVGAYGFTQILNYSLLIKNTDEGKGFRKIAYGLGIIAFRQPLVSIVTNVINSITAVHPSLTANGVVVINYLGVIVALAGFGLLSQGTEQLSIFTHKRPDRRMMLFFRVLALGLITAYTYLAIGRGGFQTPITPTGKANFYLPSWLIVSTVIVPYAYAWYLAFVAAYQLRLYSTYVHGIVYKQALNWLAAGINIVIANTILIQFISAQGSRLNKLDLGPLLVIVYLLLLSMAAGFAVVAIGAKKLKKIEEV